ncbi:MAG TPA: hypothetical protein VFP23_08980 [Solirubrobacterales bacterium]|nr:hypothetical protein [Solirubrobacterales bacterium]
MPRRRGSAAGLVFALLVLATIAAFAWSQRVKRDPLILDRVTMVGIQPRPDGRRPLRRPYFTPNGDCRFDRARIRFRVTRSDRADVQIVKPGGRLVAVLAHDRSLKRYHFFTFHWGGRNRALALARPGRYKLRVKLLEQERTLVPPGALVLRRTRPRPLPGCETTRRGALPVHMAGKAAR